jgi:threonine aldolase
VHARALAEGFHAIDPSLVEPAAIETNIVRVDVSGSGRAARRWVEDLAAEGVATSDYGRTQLRFVTHRHIGAVEVEQAVAAMRRVWERSLSRSPRAAAESAA